LLLRGSRTDERCRRRGAGTHAPCGGASQALDEAARAVRYLVIKSPTAPSCAWLAAAEARIILSVRDPRDASISMAQRFDVPLDDAVRWLANDCNRLVRLAAQGHLPLRYEDRFFDDPEAVARLAQDPRAAARPGLGVVLRMPWSAALSGLRRAARSGRWDRP
jgi:hypothetical protein